MAGELVIVPVPAAGNGTPLAVLHLANKYYQVKGYVSAFDLEGTIDGSSWALIANITADVTTPAAIAPTYAQVRAKRIAGDPSAAVVTIAGQQAG